MDSAASCHRRKDKVLVVMGATGSGKSRLSVELATLFPFSEIINSDKMQVYRGLDITPNKIPFHQRNGDVDPSHGEFSPSDFRRRAGDLISDITSRRKLPIIVGGSNSFIHSLLVEQFDPESNVFNSDPVQKGRHLRGIRKTFEDCNKVRAIVESYCVYLRERDVSMDSGFKEELRKLMGTKQVQVLVVFVKGKLIGGVDEVLKLEEEEKLGVLLEGIPMALGVCEERERDGDGDERKRESETETEMREEERESEMKWWRFDERGRETRGEEERDGEVSVSKG